MKYHKKFHSRGNGKISRFLRDNLLHPIPVAGNAFSLLRTTHHSSRAEEVSGGFADYFYTPTKHMHVKVNLTENIPVVMFYFYATVNLTSKYFTIRNLPNL